MGFPHFFCFFKEILNSNFKFSTEVLSVAEKENPPKRIEKNLIKNQDFF